MDEATPEERQKIVDLIKAGKMEFANPDALQRMDRANPDFTVTEAVLEPFGPNEHNKGGFIVRWGTKSAGFGEMSVWVKKDGTLRCDNEGMSRKFLKEVLALLVDNCNLDDNE
jgi:hypothetical protein